MKEQILGYIQENYPAQLDHPFRTSPDAVVIRHKDSQKWFGLIMTVSRETLGICGDGWVDILNVKMEPLMLDTLRTQEGFLPAYHMNKTHWMTILLDYPL